MFNPPTAWRHLRSALPAAILITLTALPALGTPRTVLGELFESEH